jgi:aminoglycoside phosphotransferase
MNTNDTFKKVLDGKFNDYVIKEMEGGETNAELFEIIVDEGKRFVLKRQIESLKTEYLNYSWLYGKIPVPEVVFYENLQDTEILCLSKLPGFTLDHYTRKFKAKEIIVMYATSLKWLHSLPIDENAFTQKLDNRILEAKYNFENDLIDPSDLQPENQSISLSKLFDKLLDSKPNFEELVFTHGDYCFDNSIYQHKNLSGLIDIGKGGVADKYQDIALAVRSIKDIYDDEYVRLFLKEYGLEELDEEKVAFYTLLDEFF